MPILNTSKKEMVEDNNLPLRCTDFLVVCQYTAVMMNMGFIYTGQLSITCMINFDELTVHIPKVLKYHIGLLLYMLLIKTDFVSQQ